MVQLIFGNEVTVDPVVKVCLVAAIGVVLVKLCCSACRRGDRMMKAPGRGGAVMRRDIMASNSYGTLSLRHILDKDNLLRGPNYLEWLKKLKIVLRHERKLYVLEEADPVEPVKGAPEAEEKAYQKFLEDSIDVQCIMLSAMIPDLQKQHEHMSAKDIDAHLRDLFQENAKVERYNTSRALFNCKMQEASSVESHVLKMIGYIERLRNLGVAMDQYLTMDLILSSLPESFSQFIMNFNMNDMKKTLPDLLAMLRAAEKDIKISKPAKQSSQVLLVDKNKRKGKGKEIPKAKKAETENKPKKGLQKPVAEEKEVICFHCGKKGHWKRNCTVFLEKKKKDAESSGTK